MSESFINSRLTSENQRFFLNSEEIIGVQSISLQKNKAAYPVKYLGMGNNTINFTADGEQGGAVSIQSFLVNKDYYINYTGDILANGYIFRNTSSFNNNYSFTSGYLTNYSCNYAIGQVPNISVNFNVVGDVGYLNTGVLNSSQLSQVNSILGGTYQVFTGVKIPHGGSIDLNINDFSTNRVTSFSIEITPQKVPVYNMGDRYPKRIDNVPPLNVNFAVTFEVGDYTFTRMRSFPQTQKTDNLTLTVKTYDTNETITSYSFNNLNLIDENYSIDVNGNTTVNSVYRGFA